MKRSLTITATLLAGSWLSACATQPKSPDPLSALEVEETGYGARCVRADLDVPSPEGTKFVLRRTLGCTFSVGKDDRQDG